MEVDPVKVTQGKAVQESAKSLFQRGDLEDAFYLYEKAEALFREAFPWPGDNVFFMQCSAIRCLEGLLDNRLDLYSIYRVKAEAFFKEWPDSKIAIAITPGRLGEALAFRRWRESYYKGIPGLKEATIAVRQGNFGKAREILNAFIAALESSTELEADAWRARALSKWHTIEVREQLNKPEDQRDLSAVVRGYALAARACHLPSTSISQQRDLLDKYWAWFISHALKFKAFAILKAEGKLEPKSMLSRAEYFLSKSKKYVNMALSGIGVNEFPKTHYLYINYWHEIVSERLHFLQFMLSGEEKCFNKAVYSWQNALTTARELCRGGGEDSFFPNRFYSLEDLNIERLYLDAGKALREKRWEQCADYLERWRQQFPQEYYFSWRDFNVRIRLLGVKAVQALLRDNTKEFSERCKELNGISLSEPVGDSARFFAQEIQELIEKQEDERNSTFNLLSRYFPLDSSTDMYQPPIELDPFRSLPQELYYDFQSPAPVSETYILIELTRAKLLGSIEALLGYICDYHSQRLGLGPSPEANLQSLFKKVKALPWVEQEERRGIKDSFKELETATEQLQTAEKLNSFIDSYDRIRGIIARLLHLMPVIVDIMPSTQQPEEPKLVKAIPNWMIERPGRGEFLIDVTAKGYYPEPTQYYLPPDWRKGTRVYYRLSKNQPLHLVRFRPRRKYWEEATREFVLSKEPLEEPDLPVLNWMARKIKRERGESLSDFVCILVLHFLTDLLPFLKQMENLGAKPKYTLLVRKPYHYQYGPRVTRKVENRGYHVFKANREIDDKFTLRVLEEAFKICLEEEKKLLILEDGGYFVPLLHRQNYSEQLYLVKGAVEQTTKGIRADKETFRRKEPLFPIVNVAESKLKESLEASEVAETLAEHIKKIATQVNITPQNAEVLLVGYGTIGEPLGDLLDKMGFGKLTIYDPEKKWKAKYRVGAHPFPTLDLDKEDLGKFDMIIGVTGIKPPPLGEKELITLKHGAILISGSSDGLEFAREALENQTRNIHKREPEFENALFTLFYVGRGPKTVKLTCDGYPINFILGEGIAKGVIDPILAELLWGLDYVIQKKEPGIHPVCEKIETEIEDYFNRWHKG